MLLLSFRDMSVNACAGVAPGMIYDLGGMPVSKNWWAPPPAKFPYPVLDPLEIRAQTQGTRACFLVHGFNVNRDAGCAGWGAAAQEMGPGGAMLDLPTPQDLYVGDIDLAIPLLWSGDWYLPVNYPFLLGDIRRTGKYFAQFITGDKPGFSNISFLTHSMGARVVLEAIQQMVVMARAMPGFRPPLIDKVIFTAGAVSDEVLDDPDYADAVAAVQQFVVVSSRADTVLSEAFPPGNAAEQALWKNDPGANDALGRYGPRLKQGSKALGKTRWFPMPATAADKAYLPPNHGSYFPDPAVLKPGFPNGWWQDPVLVGKLAQAVLTDRQVAFPPEKPVTPRP